MNCATGGARAQLLIPPRQVNRVSGTVRTPRCFSCGFAARNIAEMFDEGLGQKRAPARIFHTVSVVRCRFSLTPCFSWVLFGRRERNRFNGFPHGEQTVETVAASRTSAYTQLKQGVNESLAGNCPNQFLLVLVIEFPFVFENEEDSKTRVFGQALMRVPLSLHHMFVKDALQMRSKLPGPKLLTVGGEGMRRKLTRLKQRNLKSKTGTPS